LYCSELIVEQVQSFLPQDITISIWNIAAIGISLDEQMLDTPGMFYTLCKRLTFFWVNILDITSTYREIVFFVREEDLKKAIQVLVD
jgi:aspartokinase